MARSSSPVLRALDRWERKGLLPRDSAAVLREEVETEIQAATGRMIQFALAATGGAVLIIAGATFLAWVWPEMGYAGQATTLFDLPPPYVLRDMIGRSTRVLAEQQRRHRPSTSSDRMWSFRPPSSQLLIVDCM